MISQIVAEGTLSVRVYTGTREQRITAQTGLFLMIVKLLFSLKNRLSTRR